uniref:Uncharacterized protein n=1 Tax=Ditylenchus dipsaci TaxID=166011 RepID=A0A915DNJ2_9BILA
MLFGKVSIILLSVHAKNQEGAEFSLEAFEKSEEVSLSQAVNQSPARQTTSTVNTDKSFPSRPDSVENSTISSSANAAFLSKLTVVLVNFVLR